MWKPYHVSVTSVWMPHLRDQRKKKKSLFFWYCGFRWRSDSVKCFRLAIVILIHECSLNAELHLIFYGQIVIQVMEFELFPPGGMTECLKTAYSLFMRSCNSGGKKSTDACHNVGLLAHDGRALEGTPDLKAARQYYEKACAGGFAPSCFNLSAMFIEGNSKGMAPDMTQALKYANRACELGHVWGCANASRMYRLGDGAEKDEKKAEELKNRARELHGIEKERQLKFGEWMWHTHIKLLLFWFAYPCGVCQNKLVYECAQTRSVQVV